MAYKDKDRQRQAVREATRRYRLRRQGITEPAEDVIPVIPVIPKPVRPDRPELTKAKQTSRKGFNE